jgi:FkbM family methyltransferase
MSLDAAPDRLPLKTRLLNILREVFRIPWLERMLVRLTQGKPVHHGLVKLAPNHYQYPQPSVRHVVRNGLRYQVDISDLLGWAIYFGLYERSRERLYSLAGAGATVLDVGTNLGEVLLNLGRRVGDQGRVLGFEPDPLNHALAQRNLDLNPMPWVTLLPVGLGHEAGVFPLALNTERNRGGNRILWDATKTSTAVEVRTLDEMVALHELRRLDLIKIDVEGFELKVLRGAMQSVQRFMPHLFVELDDSNLRQQGGCARELVALLEALGYTLTHAENDARVSSAQDFTGCHFDIIGWPPRGAA